MAPVPTGSHLDPFQRAIPGPPVEPPNVLKFPDTYSAGRCGPGPSSSKTAAPLMEVPVEGHGSTSRGRNWLDQMGAHGCARACAAVMTTERPHADFMTPPNL